MYFRISSEHFSSTSYFILRVFFGKPTDAFFFQHLQSSDQTNSLSTSPGKWQLEGMNNPFTITGQFRMIWAQNLPTWVTSVATTPGIKSRFREGVASSTAWIRVKSNGHRAISSRTCNDDFLYTGGKTCQEFLEIVPTTCNLGGSNVVLHRGHPTFRFTWACPL